MTKTRADYRVVIAMTVPHHYPASCCATHPQDSTGGSPSGEGRSVKKICQWHIFSVGRSGYAASKPWFLWRIVRGSEGERETEIPLPLASLWLLSRRGESNPGSGGGTPGTADEQDLSPPHRPGQEKSLLPQEKTNACAQRTHALTKGSTAALPPAPDPGPPEYPGSPGRPRQPRCSGRRPGGSG